MKSERNVKMKQIQSSSHGTSGSLTLFMLHNFLIKKLTCLTVFSTNSHIIFYLSILELPLTRSSVHTPYVNNFCLIHSSFLCVWHCLGGIWLNYKRRPFTACIFLICNCINMNVFILHFQAGVSVYILQYLLCYIKSIVY